MRNVCKNIFNASNFFLKNVTFGSYSGGALMIIRRVR